MTPDPITRAMKIAAELHRAGRLAEAETIYRQVLARDPYHVEALRFLGTMAAQVGRPADAVELLGRAVSANPQDAAAAGDLGTALQSCGRMEEAVAAYREALRLQPAFANAHDNLGIALQRCGQIDEAIAAHRRALEIDPGHGEAHVHLGNALLEKGDVDGAIDACRSALDLDPHLSTAFQNLASALAQAGCSEEGIECQQRAIALAGNDSALESARLFGLHYLPESSPERLLAEHRDWGRRWSRAVEGKIEPHQNTPDPERVLRIGYVSPDLRDHVVGRNLLPLIRNHDWKNFEIFAYAANFHRDPVADELRASCRGWRSILGVADERAAAMIREDRIDILVDLALHSARNRLLLFARKPAPVQTTYLGYCSTTGLEAMDFRLSDPYLDPLNSNLRCYTEKTVRLPRTYWCYEPFGPTPPVVDRPAAVPGPILGSLNNFAKVSNAALDLWSEVLAEVPGSRFLLHAPPGRSRERVRQCFARRGVAGDRLEFVGKAPWEGYVSTLQRMDLALDPFPWGGGITTCDALWMGVPIVTLSGRTAVGRGGRSILSNIGLSELVAETPDEYVKIASALARDPGRLREMRAGLRERMERSPLRNGRGFARDVEEAYRQMWRGWCSVRCPR
jgi:predicted O-linked N-acetylglucosamine transferase (SPINDLY family)